MSLLKRSLIHVVMRRLLPFRSVPPGVEIHVRGTTRSPRRMVLLHAEDKTLRDSIRAVLEEVRIGPRVSLFVLPRVHSFAHATAVLGYCLVA